MRTQAHFFTGLFIEFYEQFNQELSRKNNTPEQLHQNLVQIIETQEMQIINTAGSFAQSCYRELQYLMCALADEVLLHKNWAGKQWWADNLLEYKFFNTRNAGDAIFKNIDKLLISHDNYKKNLFSSYLYLLSLGFKGKFNLKQNAEKEIKQYKLALFEAIHKQPAAQLLEKGEFFSNALVNHTNSTIYLDNHDKKFWMKTFAVIVCSYLLITHTIWVYHTFTISKITNNLAMQAKRLK